MEPAPKRAPANPPEDSRPFLILGMHRSGTSFLASMLQKWHVFIGEQLYEPGAGNIRGHFEDLGIIDFHRRAMRRRLPEETPVISDDLFLPEDFNFAPRAGEREEAEKLVEARRRPGFWGWKEPRTCLFLDFWRGMLPELQGLIVYRHPAEVYFSLLRRGHYDVIFNPRLVFRTYSIYNRKLLQAFDRQPENFLISNANAAFPRLERLEELLRERFGLAPPGGGARPAFFPEQFHTLPVTRSRHRIFSLLQPEAAEVFDALQARSAISRPLPDACADAAAEHRLSELEKTLRPCLEGLGTEEKSLLWPLAEAFTSGIPSSQIQDYKSKLAGEIKKTFHFNNALKEKFDTVWQEIEKRHAASREQHQTVQQLRRELDDFVKAHARWAAYASNLKKIIAGLEHQRGQLAAQIDVLKKT